MKVSSHKELEMRAVTWLGNRCTIRGFRAAMDRTLVDGYIPDVLAISGFQRATAHRYKLVIETDEWDSEWGYSGLKCYNSVMIFEIKVSRSDFLSTFNDSPKHANRKVPHAHFHWVVAAKGVCKAEELPEFWGFLEQCGRGLSEKKLPVYCPEGDSMYQKATEQILWAQSTIGFDAKKAFDSVQLQLEEIDDDMEYRISKPAM